MARLKTLLRRRRHKNTKKKGLTALSRLYIADEEQTILMTPLERREHSLFRSIYLTEMVASLSPAAKKNALKMLRRRYAEFRAKHGDEVDRLRHERSESFKAFANTCRSPNPTVIVVMQSLADFEPSHKNTKCGSRRRVRQTV